MGIAKYLSQQHNPEEPGVYFGRSVVDAVPFRGQNMLVQEAEWEARTHEVVDGYVRLFDLSVPEDMEKLQEIIDRAGNDWYQISRMTEQFVPLPDGGLKAYVYCVWYEQFREWRGSQATGGGVASAN